MPNTNIPRHDLHIHTHLSARSPGSEAAPEAYIRRAAELGIRTIGFTDHVWDERVPFPAPETYWYKNFYQGQSVERLRSLRDAIPADTLGVRVLIGAEAEFAQGVLGITPEAAATLDFVLAAHSHIGMLDFVRPRTMTSPRDIAAHMLASFNDLVTRGIATIAAHPFWPDDMADPVNLPLVFSFLSDGAFENSFGRAAEFHVGIEINLSIFNAGGPENPVYDDTYFRMYRIAKKMGCKFSLGSDSHTVSNMDLNGNFEKALRRAGLDGDDFVELINPPFKAG
jgi:histidinol phosphatase-like PHP family hydrolase